MSADSWNITAEPSAGVSMLPGVGRSSPAMRLSSVDLPHPEAPSRHTNSPGRDVERDVVEHERPAAEPLADVLDPHGRRDGAARAGAPA